MNSPKKLEKSRAKLEKKRAKAEAKACKREAEATADTESPSRLVRYSDIVRGSLLILTAVSLLVALALGQRGAILSLDDVVSSLFAASLGKIALALIGIGLMIGGFKKCGLIK